MAASIAELLAPTLTALGLPAPDDVIQTMLVKERYFVGHKFRYAGGHAFLKAGANTLELYDEQGTLLRTVALDTQKGAAA